MWLKNKRFLNFLLVHFYQVNQIKKPPKGGFLNDSENYLRLFTESLNALPAVNLTVLAAAILIASPVFGLRPVRAARLPWL